MKSRNRTYDKLSKLEKIAIEDDKEHFSEFHTRNIYDKTSSNLFHNNSSKNISVLKNTNSNSTNSCNKNSSDAIYPFIQKENVGNDCVHDKM